jgi:hypothetical protein
MRQPLDDRVFAYVAGLLDAQGLITVRTDQAGSVLPVVALSIPNQELVSWLGTLTSTTPTITKRQFSRHRCTEHCPTNHQQVSSVSMRWIVTGAKATVVLRAVRPWLRFQTEQADSVLAVADQAPYKPATFQKMRELGWPVGDSSRTAGE